MCDFFSCVSDGKGKVYYFTPETVAKIMSEGNPKNYDFNSHTSVADYHGFPGVKEDPLNKWEYNPEKKVLTKDRLATTNDEKKVKRVLVAFFKDKDILWLRNLYGRNSGHSNSGHSNSGNRNSGDWNSGNRNSGNRNSGDWNSGNRNSGHSNSGNRNSGNRNSGHSNSGNRNSGNRNSGHSNSGNRNSGDWNSGDWNSGHRNSGFFNTDTPTVRMFNKDTGLKWDEINFPNCLYNLKLTEWVWESSMTTKEKKENPDFYVNQGYLKVYDYPQAWKNLKLTKEQKAEIKKLPNFDKNLFKEITGIGIA